MNILQLIISLSILVFVHELGHFSFARLFGARVEKFYLFFNPWFSLLKYKSRCSGTIYGLGWLPLGGYCQIAGMVDESLDSEQLASEPKPDEFRSKAPWQRLLIMAGGIIFNLVLAFVIYTGVALAWGDKYLASDQAHYGWTFAPVAHEVGFRDGDVIVSVDGHEGMNVLDRHFISDLIEAHTVVVRRADGMHTITMPSDMMQRLLRAETGFASLRTPFVIDSVASPVASEAGLMAGMEIVRIGNVQTPNLLDVSPQLQSYRGDSVDIVVRTTEHVERVVRVPVDTAGHVGVQAKALLDMYAITDIEYNLLQAIPAGYEKAATAIGGYVGGLKHVFTKEGAQSLGGLGTMARLFPEGFDWQVFWLTTAFLSIILAVMNLLPIPALDGGHIIFILVEMITRRKLSDKVMMYIQTAGMVLLLLLMLYANGNDVYRYLIK